jgi:hypothetical protein
MYIQENPINFENSSVICEKFSYRALRKQFTKEVIDFPKKLVRYGRPSPLYIVLLNGRQLEVRF